MKDVTSPWDLTYIRPVDVPSTGEVSEDDRRSLLDIVTEGAVGPIAPMPSQLYLLSIRRRQDDHMWPLCAFLDAGLAGTKAEELSRGGKIIGYSIEVFYSNSHRHHGPVATPIPMKLLGLKPDDDEDAPVTLVDGPIESIDMGET